MTTLAAAPTWYVAWAKRHATAFGLASEADLSMVLSWWAGFAPHGFREDELHDATEWMVGQSAPQYRGDHLRLIQQRVYGQRRAARHAARAEVAERQRSSACEICSGLGWAVVPHWLDVRGGEWCEPWRTCAVTCRCESGRLVASDAAKRELPAESLDDYESLVDGAWREHMREREEQTRREAQLHAAANYRDKMSPLVGANIAARLAKGWQS